MAIYTTHEKLVNKVVTTTTGEGVVIGDRLIKSFHFVRSGASAGVVKCYLQVSNNNGDNWVTYNRLISNSAAGASFTTVNLEASGNNANQIAFTNIGDEFQLVRAYVNYNNGDGNITITLQGR